MEHSTNYIHISLESSKRLPEFWLLSVTSPSCHRRRAAGKVLASSQPWPDKSVTQKTDFLEVLFFFYFSYNLENPGPSTLLLFLLQVYSVDPGELKTAMCHLRYKWGRQQLLCTWQHERENTCWCLSLHDPLLPSHPWTQCDCCWLFIKATNGFLQNDNKASQPASLLWGTSLVCSLKGPCLVIGLALAMTFKFRYKCMSGLEDISWPVFGTWGFKLKPSTFSHHRFGFGNSVTLTAAPSHASVSLHWLNSDNSTEKLVLKKKEHS